MTVRMRFRTAAVGVALLAMPFVPRPQAQTSAGQHWVATWGTAQQAYRSAAPAGRGTPPPAPATPPPPAPAPTGPQRRFGIPATLPGLNNQSVRMIVRTSIGGSQVRIRLSQAFGAPAVTVGAAHIAMRSAGAGIAAGTDRPITFSGQPSAVIYAGQTVVRIRWRSGCRP